ncbi:Allene oxide cyclase [Hyphomicrobium methylovorum]|uniref:allene oxide cyclase family protein n=1 Tax=Hyphomicrobium methylovorum TaxID=84 RepID=UPI0015E71C50|nr:allene oxide cyclase family protein [Hyphomicrobium methylovorum]MBA2124790.1 Allene oxide cyclase [Hyphomicrobium methylovorum]
MKHLRVASRIVLSATFVSFWASSQALADKVAVVLVEHNSNWTTTDTGAPGDSVGDVMTFANTIFDAKNEKQVGTNNGVCIRTVVAEAYECNWTTFLADGQISVAGPFYDAKDATLAVTGGTGAYEGMHGQLKVHARDAKATEIDFRFELSK